MDWLVIKVIDMASLQNPQDSAYVTIKRIFTRLCFVNKDVFDEVDQKKRIQYELKMSTYESLRLWTLTSSVSLILCGSTGISWRKSRTWIHKLLKRIPRCNSTHESPWKDYYSRGRVRQ